MVLTYTYSSDRAITPIAADVLREARSRAFGDEEVRLEPHEGEGEADISFGSAGGRIQFPSVGQLMASATAVSDAVAAFLTLRGHDTPTMPEHLIDTYPLEGFEHNLVVDIEVGGNVDKDMPWETPLLSVAVYDGVHNPTVYTPEWIRENGLYWLERHHVIAHNGRFDTRTINHQCGTNIRVGDDTLLMFYTLNHGAKEKGLKALARKFLGAPEWEHGLKKYTVGGAHYENIPSDLLYSYNAADVFYTYYLWKLFQPQMIDEKAGLYHHILRISDLLGVIEDSGIGIDVDYYHDLANRLDSETVELLEHLKGTNPNSPKQVKELFESVGHALPNTNEKTLTGLLKTLPEDDPGRFLVDSLLEYRGKTKLRATYAVGMLERARGNVVYPSYLVHGTTTGRLSSKNPNIQNLPRGPLIREGIVPVNNYNVLAERDFSQAELRTMAELSDDKDLIAAFQPGMPDFFDQLMPSMYPEMFSAIEDYWDYKENDTVHAKELRARVKGVIYGCVPMDTKILTRRGWLTYDEVQVGDETPGIDGWTTIRDKVHYTDAPVERFGNSRFSVISTADHRWAFSKRLPKRFGMGYEETHTMTLQRDLGREGVIRVAADTTDRHDDGLTDQEVQIISWLLSDGHVKQSTLTGSTSQGSDGRRRGIIASIMQGKPQYVAEIHALLDGVPHAVDHREGVNLPMTVWRLRSEYARTLWNRSGLDLTDPVSAQQFVLRLNRRHLGMFLDVFCKAEGNLLKNGTWAITQKEGDKAEAVLLAARLCGYRATKVRHSEGVAKIHLNKVPYVTTQVLKREPAGISDVWCVVTDSETWTMRQGDTIAITGNSAYGRGPAAIGEALGMPKEGAQELIDNYFSTFPDLAQWRRNIERAIIDPEYAHFLTTPFGRTFQHEVVTNRNYNSVRNAALAFPPQSTANDICLSAAIEVNKQVDEYGATIRALIHDAILLETPPETANDVLEMVGREMEKSAAQVFHRVPFETDGMVGKTWRELDE